jgi:hypothetical protein
MIQYMPATALASAASTDGPVAMTPMSPVVSLI